MALHCLKNCRKSPGLVPANGCRRRCHDFAQPSRKERRPVWFAFFHEAGHVINENKKDLYINSGDKTDLIEVRADEFAADMLIPRKYESEIRMIRSKAEILQFARKLDISSGIVVGRYQHLTGNYQLFNDLKTRFSWSEQQS